MIRVVWDGLEDLKAGIVALPADLIAGAIPLTRAAAARAAADIVAAYPKVTGELAGGVAVHETKDGPYGVTVTVVNLTWWAIVYEYGSKDRYTGGRRNRRTGLFGPRRYRGVMPRRPVFGPRTWAQKRALGVQLAALMRDAGLVVRAA